MLRTILPKELIQLAQQRAAGFPVEGFLRGEGPENPQALLIGEAPGAVEVTTAEDHPFAGRAGIELMKFLDTAGLSRENTYITSVFHSRPFKDRLKLNKRTGMEEVKRYNRKPSGKEVLAHAPLTDYEIRHIDAPLIVLLGTSAIERVLGKQAAVKDLHGKVLTTSVQYLADLEDGTYRWTDKKYSVLCTYHPASIFYNRQLEAEIQEDMRAVKNWLENMDMHENK
ncbi:uracil-DNA glycosylase [Desemzia sp. RIT804]|uniref:uracil-DNA glycosylase n=1 Tax=Desemzia sp. RIT 804 TaxID=2810209 RepID=UPI00194FE3E9|nr:uracil-DNA glycosylase [Desemzia sp. RIT 804]MBM6614804.1 uracil-DNA glycosylase [Desemzia sp. RIT 804]